MVLRTLQLMMPIAISTAIVAFAEHTCLAASGSDDDWAVGEWIESAAGASDSDNGPKSSLSFDVDLARPVTWQDSLQAGKTLLVVGSVSLVIASVLAVPAVILVVEYKQQLDTQARRDDYCTTSDDCGGGFFGDVDTTAWGGIPAALLASFATPHLIIGTVLTALGAAFERKGLIGRKAFIVPDLSFALIPDLDAGRITLLWRF